LIVSFIHKNKDTFAEGVRVEQERIIALLESSMAECSENKKPEGCDACYGQRDAIALIKGENK
jgi:hypothetical protein